MTELTPCPICGSRAFLTLHNAPWCTQDQCITMGARESKELSIAAWNTRAPSTDPAPTISSINVHDEREAAARAALEAAAKEAKVAWVSADYATVGIADAAACMRVCEHAETTIRAIDPAQFREG